MSISTHRNRPIHPITVFNFFFCNFFFYFKKKFTKLIFHFNDICFWFAVDSSTAQDDDTKDKVASNSRNSSPPPPENATLSEATLSMDSSRPDVMEPQPGTSHQTIEHSEFDSRRGGRLGLPAFLTLTLSLNPINFSLINFFLINFYDFF